jgi:uncharacterized damage-inducible protein DinB
MDPFFKSFLWPQFGACLDMLENAMHACPDALWTGSRFWHITYHTLFFLDLFLSESAENFAPPEPFTLSELDPSGLLPDRTYTKEELQMYLDHCRQKSRAAIESLTGERADLFLHTMRHIQHHAGQLNLMLHQHTDSAPRWVKHARS